MNQKQIKAFALILFSIIGFLILLTIKKKSDIFDDILKSDVAHLHNVKFYKDFLRNEGGLNIPIKDRTEIKTFLTALKTIQKTGYTLKSLTTKTLYRVRFNLKVAENRLLTINIYKNHETGNLGIITINEGDTFVTSGGTYESKELLSWAEKIKKKKGYKKIGGAY